MSLLVVEKNPGASPSLSDQLGTLGYASLSASSLNAAFWACDHAHPELIVCDELDWSARLADQYRYIPVALASRAKKLSSAILLKAMRAGLADVWRLPGDASEVGERVSEMLGRAKAVAGQLEARLDQFVKDLKRDQQAGRHIQMGMLPPNPMAIEGYRLMHRIVPSLLLSGDFVDYFRMDERHFVFYIADVSGHGASSAFVTVLLKNFSRRLRREYQAALLANPDPGEILKLLNHALLDQSMDKHVAMLVGVCDLQAHTLRFANAGHFPLPILVTGGEARMLPMRGKPLGLFDEVAYDIETVSVQPGDRLTMFTDGVLEALSGQSLADKEQALVAAAAQHSGLDGLWRHLELTDSEDMHGPDDIACLMLARDG